MDQALLKSTQTFLGPPKGWPDGLQSPVGSTSNLQNLNKTGLLRLHSTMCFFSFVQQIDVLVKRFLLLFDPRMQLFSTLLIVSNFDQMCYKTQMLWVVFSESRQVQSLIHSCRSLSLQSILLWHFFTVFSALLSTQFLSSVRRHPFSSKEAWCTHCPTLRSSSAPQMTSGAPVNTLTISCPISCLTSSLRVYFFKDMVNLAASVSSSWALVWFSSHYFACGLLWLNSRHLKSSCKTSNSVSFKKKSVLKFGVLWLHHKHCWFGQYTLQLQDL